MLVSLRTCLFILLAVSASCCSNDEPEPLKDIIGRWQVQSMKSTVYAADGKVDYTSDIPGDGDDYYTFAADKTFEFYYNANRSLFGTYTYTNTSLTLTTAQGPGTSDITTFTTSNLTLTDGRKEAGKRSVVQVTTLVKR